MEEQRCSDPVFGEMRYRHRWYKVQEIQLLGKNWQITVAAAAYTGKPITPEEQKSYLRFQEKESEYLSSAGQALVTYVNSNVRLLAEEWPGARMISGQEDLSVMVTPKTLLFQRDGNVVLLLDCVWDPENGVAVRIIPDMAVGIQDEFL